MRSTTNARPFGVLGIAAALFLGVSGAAFAQAPQGAGAPSAELLPLIAIPVQNTAEVFSFNVDAFVAGMAELGYHDGLNVRYDIRYGDGSPATGTANADAVLAMNPDIIVVGGSGSSRLIAGKTSTIPIVAAHARDALTQLVQNPDRPEGNITGRMEPVLTVAADFDWLRELIPGITRIGVLHASDFDRQEAIDAAAPRGITPVFQQYGDRPEDVVQAYHALAAQGVQAITVWGSIAANSATPLTVAAAQQARIPTLHCCPPAVPGGGLTGITTDTGTHWHLVAYFVDRLLQGATIADLPVLESPPTHFLHRVNVNTARDLGLTVPQSILNRAEVFGDQ